MLYVFAGASALLVVLVEAALLRALVQGASGAVLFVKLSLWAGFFMALTLLDRRALPVGGAAAWALYMALAFWLVLRSHGSARAANVRENDDARCVPPRSGKKQRAAK